MVDWPHAALAPEIFFLVFVSAKMNKLLLAHSFCFEVMGFAWSVNAIAFKRGTTN